MKTIILFLIISTFMAMITFVNLYNIRDIKSQVLVSEHVLGERDQFEAIKLPVRLKIPVIDVDAQIEHVDSNQNGEMDSPSSPFNAGWFKIGTIPGHTGSAVIAGHLDGEFGEKGVFAEIHKLQAGDKIYVEDDQGGTLEFIVRETRTYDPGYADEVFALWDRARLNLITCDGEWDFAKNSYRKRLVVFAELSQ